MDDNTQLLTLFDELRVADVRDGLDWVGMMHYGSMSPDIRPLYRTRAVGIARTARYLPYGGPLPEVRGEDYTAWSNWYYGEVCTYPWESEIQPGDLVVIDASGVDAGLLGSNNTLAGVQCGVRGYVTSGGIRDTDEVVMQQIPCWSRYASQGMVQGRLQYDAHNVPIAVGGVLVNPGDVVVADGDGVIVVPRHMACEVAKFALRELTGDKQSRRARYEALGRDLDESVR